ncbi:MAG TPA: glycosyltransferase [Acidimicrobiia bacterium]|nr:glycosyltransferase [Acidimicrobiia bacterium]
MSSDRADRTRILVLIKGLGIGGAERLISDGAEHWDRDRFEYRVAYVLPWKDHLVEPLRRLGVEVDCVGSKRGMGPTALRGIRRLVRVWRPGLIHAHLPSAGILARVSGSAPVVYTEHNIASSYRQPTRSLNRLSYGRNAAVIAVSAAVADSLQGYPGPTPRVIPNGITFQVTATEVAAVREELGLVPGQRLVVHVGNIRPHKGHENLIAATKRIVKADPNVLVVSVGAEKHEGDLARVRESAAVAGVSEHIRFLGRREEARAFLAAADAVVNPADFEGLPLAVLEALSLSKPVVATAVGGVPTVVIDGVTGRLVPPGDAEALADGVLEALSSPDAGLWGAAGAELVSRNHGIAQMISEYEKTYEEVAGA